MKLASLFLGVFVLVASAGNENSATTVEPFGWRTKEIRIAVCAGRHWVSPLSPHVSGADSGTRYASLSPVPSTISLDERGEISGVLEVGQLEIRILAMSGKLRSATNVMISAVDCVTE